MGAMLKKAVLFGFGFLVLAAGTASADVLQVQVPFAFEVSGQLLPAGDYRIERHATSGTVVLIRGEQSNQPSMFVVTIPSVGPSPAGNTPVLTFTPGETRHRLTGIWESASAGHEIPGAGDDESRVAQVVVVGRRVS